MTSRCCGLIAVSWIALHACTVPKPSGSTCEPQCPPGSLCVQGECRDQCTDKSDCEPGQHCNTSVGVCEASSGTSRTTSDTTVPNDSILGSKTPSEEESSECSDHEDCDGGTCECADASCEQTRCSEASCDCGYTTDGKTCAGPLDKGFDDTDDHCGPSYCDGAGGCEVLNGTSCESDADCSGSTCECANAQCSAQLCSEVKCPCGYNNSDGDSDPTTCDGFVNDGVDDVQSTCVPQTCNGAGKCNLADGERATGIPQQCESNIVENGVCCATTCPGNCNRCDLSGREGQCVIDHNSCGGNCSRCGEDGRCEADHDACSDLGDCATCSGSGSSYSCVEDDQACDGDCAVCEEQGGVFDCQPKQSVCHNTCDRGTCEPEGSEFNCDFSDCCFDSDDCDLGWACDSSTNTCFQRMYSCSENSECWGPIISACVDGHCRGACTYNYQCPVLDVSGTMGFICASTVEITTAPGVCMLNGCSLFSDSEPCPNGYACKKKKLDLDGDGVYEADRNVCWPYYL